MTEIPFTQYLMPDGRPRRVTIDRPDAIAEKAHRLLENGCRLEIEMLATGRISMTVERDVVGDEEVQTLGHYICDNGPGMEGYVDKLIITAMEENDESTD